MNNKRTIHTWMSYVNTQLMYLLRYLQFPRLELFVRQINFTKYFLLTLWRIGNKWTFVLFCSNVCPLLIFFDASKKFWAQLCYIACKITWWKYAKKDEKVCKKSICILHLSLKILWAVLTTVMPVTDKNFIKVLKIGVI